MAIKSKFHLKGSHNTRPCGWKNVKTNIAVDPGKQVWKIIVSTDDGLQRAAKIGSTSEKYTMADFAKSNLTRHCYDT
jgi:hypothetical protein